MPRQLEQPLSPDPAIARILGAPADQPLALLHSGRFDPTWARRSFFALPRATYRYTAGHRSELSFHTHSDRPLPTFTHDLWTDLRHLLDWPGKWIGYISYDIARLIEPGKLTQGRPHLNDWPLVELAWCPEVEEMPATVPPEARGLDPEASAPVTRFTSNFSRADYESAVTRVLDYIRAGDVFQVNLAQRFAGEYVGDPRHLFARLATISPAWYGAYLEFPFSGRPEGALAERGARNGERGTAQRAVCSTSPELFLDVADRRVITRPIKGTRPNRATNSDASTADPGYHDLLNAEKDTAELNMIVDLMRNDLGRVCTYGSVQVAAPRQIESHPTVHHGVATVAGTLHPSRDVVDLLRATLPGGSVTGAPKVRAMQIIDELEPHPRGPYCGVIGWLTRDACQLNIAIRTILLTRNDTAPSWQASFSVGGGIVADSDPAAEYEETITKARAMVAALARRAPSVV